jgi:hypothetical protein
MENKMLARYSLTAAAVLCATFGSLSYADSVLVNAHNYSELQQQVESLKDPSHTLVVLDDDNTLTTLPCPDAKNLGTCQYLGGTAWGIWQGNLPSNSPLKVAPTNDQIYKINNLLFAMSQSVYTESDVPSVLQNLTNSGVKILIETARDPSMVTGTESQLSALKTANNDSFLNFINQNALQNKEGGANAPGIYTPCNDSSHRKVRYESGVYYLAGQNKGVMLNCLFQDLKLNANPAITHIVFMDDTPSNVNDVYQFFKTNPNYDVISINYHGMDAHRDAFLKGPMAAKYQKHATKVWHQLNDAIQAGVSKPSYLD